MMQLQHYYCDRTDKGAEHWQLVTDLNATGAADLEGVAAAVTGAVILPGLSAGNWTEEHGQSADQTVDQVEGQLVEQAAGAGAIVAGHYIKSAVMVQPLGLQKEFGG